MNNPSRKIKTLKNKDQLPKDFFQFVKAARKEIPAEIDQHIDRIMTAKKNSALIRETGKLLAVLSNARLCSSDGPLFNGREHPIDMDRVLKMKLVSRCAKLIGCQMVHTATDDLYIISFFDQAGIIDDSDVFLKACKKGLVSINNVPINRPELGFAIDAAEELLEIDGSIFFDFVYVTYKNKHFLVSPERS